MKQQVSNPKITPEVIKNSIVVECECGGKIFTEKLVIKKLSAILSSTGNEELLPLPVIICEKCGKIPSVFDPQNLLPRELIASSIKLTN